MKKRILSSLIVTAMSFSALAFNYQEHEEGELNASKIITDYASSSEALKEKQVLDAEIEKIREYIQSNTTENVITNYVKETGDDNIGLERLKPELKTNHPIAIESVKKLETIEIEPAINPEAVKKLSQTYQHALKKMNTDTNPGACANYQKTIDAWKAGWVLQKTDRYFSQYDKNFKGEESSRENWEKIRTSRIMNAKNISITIEPINFSFQDGLTTATFKQHYSSNHYSDKVIKTLTMRDVGGSCVIVNEKSVKI